MWCVKKMKKMEKNFEKMLDIVCLDIMNKHNGKFVGLSLSGGMDSTAILLSLRKTGKKFIPVYVRAEKNFEKLNIGWEQRFQDFMVEHITHIFNLPLVMLPVNRNDKYPSHISLFSEFGIKTIISGNGMDRCYGQFNEDRRASFGMEFRAFHPLIDMLLRTVPARIVSYRKTTYDERLDDDSVAGREYNEIMDASRKFGVEFEVVSSHPMFIEFFKKYNENIKDIFFPKMLTHMYIKKNLGMSFNSLCKDVYKMNKPKMKAFPSRLLQHLS